MNSQLISSFTALIVVVILLSPSGQSCATDFVVSNADGDLNADQTIDFLNDVARVVSRLGQSSGSFAATAAVPESSGGSFLALVLLINWAKRKRRTEKRLLAV